jgi:hypothetical protein
MAQDPLVWREPISASCNRRRDESLETQKYSQYPKEHPANCPLRWRLSNGLGVYLSWLQAAFSHHTRQLNWWSVHQRCLATSCWPPFRQPPTSYNICVYGWQRQASSFKSSNRLPPKWTVTSVPWPAMSSDLNPIEHIWCKLVRRIQAGEPPVQNLRQLEAALHQKWQQLPQQDIRRLTGGMKRRVRPPSKHVGVTSDTELWTLDVVKWFISDVLKVKCPNRSPLRSWDYLVSNLVILVVSFVISKKHGDA